MTAQYQIPETFNTIPAERYAGKAVFFVWVSGAVCVLAVLLFLFLEKGKSEKLFIASEKEAQNSGKGRTTDNILITSKDAFFADNKTFVNTSLRYQKDFEKAAVYSSDSSRANLYNNIFRDRLNRAARQRKTDFSVGPVPQ